MAESASNTRRTFLGGSAAATIPAGLAAGGLTATGNDLSTWAGCVANGPTRVMINRLGAVGSNPEEVEVSGIAGNVLTFSARGLRGTADQAHPANVSIEIVGSPRDFDEANDAVAETVGKITAAEQVLVSDGANSFVALLIPASRVMGRKATGSVVALTQAEQFAILGSGTPGATTFLRGDGSWQVPAYPTTATFYTTHTWAIAGEVKVPSGDTDFLVPMFVAEGASEVVTLDKVRYVINSGTSATFKLQVNGSDATGFTALAAATTAATTNPSDVALADTDKLVPVVTAVAATPKNLSITVFLKHTVTLT